MKILPIEFTTTIGHFLQICRENNVAIYHRRRLESGEPVGSGNYEIIRINRRNAGEIMGRPVEAGEIYPGSAAWGTYGLTSPNLDHAKVLYKQFQEKFKGKDNLIGPKTEEEKAQEAESGEVRHRGRKPLNVSLQFPKGEWTIKQIADKHNVSPAYVHLQIKPMIDKKEIIFVKSAKTTSGRGKPAAFYKVTDKKTVKK